MDTNFGRFKYVVHLLFVIGVSVSYTQSVMACSCKTASLSESYEASDVVFTARIAHRTNPSKTNHSKSLFAFEKLESYKGNIKFTEISTSSGSCGIHFEPGAEYLVFASDVGLTGACSGTRQIQSSDGTRFSGMTWLNSLKLFKEQGKAMVPGWTTTVNKSTCLLSGEVSPGGKFVIGYVPKSGNRDEIYELRFNMPVTAVPRHARDLKPLRNVNLGFGQTSIGFKGSSNGGLVRAKVDREEFYLIVEELEKITSSDKAVATVTASGEKRNVVISTNDESSGNAFEEFSECMRQLEKKQR